ncbi:MAG: alpha/beta hydrolase [Boseongicola sp.]|nr:alpha/beta hydrolase [Boseongicola sp.]MYI70365.1 alpha/beta hydrolase [Boseongicola sp. SB0673_bin_14]
MRNVVVDGVKTDLRRKGQGRSRLFLQGIEGWIRDEEFAEPLASSREVLLLQNPGFGNAELPLDFRQNGNFAQFYHHMQEERDLGEVVVVNTSFGGWIAADGQLELRENRRAGAVEPVRHSRQR